MQLNAIIAAAILAGSAYATPVSTTTSAKPAASTIIAAAPPKDTLLTNKLFNADTAADRFALLPDDSQFVFKFGDPKLRTNSTNGDIVTANRKTFPPLVGTGSALAVGFLEGCGFNTPHVHPRSVELQIVTSGTLVVEMLPENGVFKDNDATKGRRVITNTLGVNDMTPFYLGSIHTQFNPNCEPATFVAAFNNEDPGVGQVADELFALTDDVVGAVFGQSIPGADIDKFRKSVSKNVAKGVEACLMKCNRKKN